MATDFFCTLLLVYSMKRIVSPSDFGTFLKTSSPHLSNKDVPIEHWCENYFSPFPRSHTVLKIKAESPEFWQVLFEALCGRQTYAEDVARGSTTWL